MFRVGLVMACALVSGVTATTPQRPAGVMLDGRFDDWAGVPVALEDPEDADGAAIDIGQVHLQSDADWLYVAVDVRRDVTIQSLPGTLRLLLDADADAATGGTVLGMTGVDYTIDYSFIASPEAGRGVGAAIWRVSDDGKLEGPVTPYARELTVMPVHASRRFEMRIARRGADRRLRPLGPSTRVKLTYLERDAVVDETGEATLALAASDGTADGRVARPLDWIRRADGTVRVAHWNVSGGSFRADPAGFARLLAVVAPDVVTLSELPGDVTDVEVRGFLDRPSLRALGTWTFVLGGAGGRQRAVVASRNLALRPAGPLVDVRYEPAALDRLQASLPADMQPIIDLERERGVSTVGGWVDVGARRVLAVGLDLQSSGWVGSYQDQLRELQARTIRDRIDAALIEDDVPVIVGGDLNLVGSRAPLAMLASRAEADGEELVAVEARRLGERTLTTWRNPALAFTPGRLDYLLVPPQVDVVRGFALATDDLDAATLEALGVDEALSSRLSDHLIVVADLRFR